MNVNDLNALQALILVHEKGSFVAAANELRVSSGAVSLAVSRLEIRWGVQLAVRTTRKVKLTDAAKALVSQCATAITTFEEAFAGLDAETATA